MDNRLNFPQANANSPFKIWLLTGVTSILLAILMVMLFTRSVEANEMLPGAVTSAPPAPQFALDPPAPVFKKSRVNVFLHGMASWYGTAFHGRRTANGERFDMNALTACHPTLPFGSLVRVVNLSNHKSVVVRITDRGYLLPGRVIDLSYAAANQLAMVRKGVTRVSIEVIPQEERQDRVKG